MIDWSDGVYETTAEALAPVGELGVRALALAPGARVLDLGCGTGNAALAAARSGARVVAVDPAARLVEVTRARAAHAGLALEALVADAAQIPAEDGSFDGVVSVFAVIFADDAERVASEMLRVVRPGGRVVMSSWLPRGGIADAGKLLREAAAELAPPDAPRAPPRWGDPAFVRDLFASRGARVEIDEHVLVFEADSAEAWFDAQEREHPLWRFVHRALAARPGGADRWSALRERTVACLHAASDGDARLRVASPYFLVTATR